MKNINTWSAVWTICHRASVAVRLAEEYFSLSPSDAFVSRDGHQRPEIGAEGERLEDGSHSTPEREPVQGVLESNRIARLSRPEQGRGCLRGGEHASKREERGCRERERPGARSAPAA